MRTYRLCYLGRMEALSESEIRASNVTAAISAATELAWPSDALGLRLIDVDSGWVTEQPRGGHRRIGELESFSLGSSNQRPVWAAR